MAENDSVAGFRHDSKCLAKLVYDFLMKECKKKNLKKMERLFINKALSNMAKVYKFKKPDMKRSRFSLCDIFNVGFHPVPIKNRLSAETHKRKGNEYMHHKFYILAELEYTQAIRLNPYNAIYLCNCAAAKIMHNKIHLADFCRNVIYLDAASDCNKALELDSTYTKAYIWLGFAHVTMGYPDRAVHCYQKVLEIDPENEISRENIDLINRKINRETFKDLKTRHSWRHALARIFNVKAQNQNRKSKNSANKKAPKEKSAKMKIFNIVELEEFNLAELD